MREVFLTKEKISFLLVGGFNTIFGYAVFAANYSLFGKYIGSVGALISSHLVSASIAYLLFRKFVFVDSERGTKSYFRFHSVYIVPLLSNIFALPALIALFNLSAYLAQALFSAGWIIVSYVTHKRFTFKSAKKE
jgi:putative flippase GtrA